MSLSPEAIEVDPLFFNSQWTNTPRHWMMSAKPIAPILLSAVQPAVSYPGIYPRFAETEIPAFRTTPSNQAFEGAKKLMLVFAAGSVVLVCLLEDHLLAKRTISANNTPFPSNPCKPRPSCAEPPENPSKSAT